MENNQQQPLPPQQQTDQLHSISSKTSYHPPKTFIILILVLIIAVVGAGGYFVGANQNQVTQDQSYPTPPITQPSPIPADEAANWKTYTNTKYGFKLNYTSTLFQNCSKTEDYFVLFYGNEDKKEDCAAGEPSIGFAVDVIKDPLEAEKKSQNFKKSYNEKCYAVTTADIKIDGLNATKYWNLVKDINSSECNQLEIAYARYKIHVVLKRNDMIYILSYNRYDQEQLKDQILSTFRFD